MVFICSCKSAIEKTIESLPICVETQNSNSKVSELIKTCYYQNHIFKSVGIPDYKGRYSYEYEIFEIKGTDTIKTKNSNFFKNGTKTIEKLINQKLKEEYESDLAHPELKKCMAQIDFRYYNIDEFGISFHSRDIMQFNIAYNGVSGACFNVSGNSVLLQLDSFVIIK